MEFIKLGGDIPNGKFIWRKFSIKDFHLLNEDILSFTLYTCRFACSFLCRRQSANWPAFTTGKSAKLAKVKDEKNLYFNPAFQIFYCNVCHVIALLAIKLKVKMSVKMNIAWKIFSPNHSFITFITLLSAKLHNLWRYEGQISPFSYAFLPCRWQSAKPSKTFAADKSFAGDMYTLIIS